MLTYILIKEENNVLTYKFFPEEQDEFGIASIDKSNGKYWVDVPAPNDKYNDYLSKMYKRFREFIKTGDYKKEGMVAWY